jgi:hypothetical protein
MCFYKKLKFARLTNPAILNCFKAFQKLQLPANNFCLDLPVPSMKAKEKHHSFFANAHCKDDFGVYFSEKITYAKLSTPSGLDYFLIFPDTAKSSCSDKKVLSINNRNFNSYEIPGCLQGFF